jgi:hypothetical protein
LTSAFGSLEVFFTYPSNVAKSIDLLTNIQGVQQFGPEPEELEDVTISVTSVAYSGTIYIQIQTTLGTVVVDQSDFSTYQTTAIDFAVRIFFFDQFVSVYLNNKWVYSYAFSSVAYADDTTASIKLNGATTTITGIRRVELSDGREAIFVDYESNTESAIQSIIQQRPILMLPHVNRKLSFTYRAEKDTISAVFVNRYTERISHPSQLSSDGLVYSDDVGVSIDTETAREVGFITKLYRLPELTNGAIRAAGTLQRQARERRIAPTVAQRMDPRIELTDVLHVSLTVAGTLRQIDRYIVVENPSIAMKDGDYSMNITGRKKS